MLIYQLRPNIEVEILFDEITHLLYPRIRESLVKGFCPGSYENENCVQTFHALDSIDSGSKLETFPSSDKVDEQRESIRSSQQKVSGNFTGHQFEHL